MARMKEYPTSGVRIEILVMDKWLPGTVMWSGASQFRYKLDGSGHEGYCLFNNPEWRYADE